MIIVLSNIHDATWAAQTFTPAISHAITKVKLILGSNGTPGDLTIMIKATSGGEPTGDALCTGTQVAADIPDSWSGTQVFVDFDVPTSLIAGTKYAIVCKSLTSDGANYVQWYKKTTDVYAGGNALNSVNSGDDWTPAATYDFAFEEWGVVGPPVDQVTIKKLVAAADNAVYYEDEAGSMTAIVAADEDVDTTKQLVMFEAFQKVIVVNGTNLKVADFINTRLDLGAGNELTDPPAKGDILTQTTSGAKMVVDFVDSTKRYIYGYTTTDEVFTTTAGHTLVSGDETATMDPNPAPEPDVVSEASTTPLWYDYSTYPDIVLSVEKYGQTIGSTKTFGILPQHGVFPAKAYLGCLYRGRVVLAGNPNYPHQWYMSRQANIWDYAYLAGDGQAPVVGNNAEAGEIGDVITCLIPYKDDYLIFGGANKIHVLRGDPAKSGELDPVDLTVGIFGDGDSNLYFWGTNGIYMMPAGFGSVKCLTENTIPNILADENVDPSTHRISLGYDRKRRGILVCITVLATGVNSNYWYDLRTGGFFPESYPTVCGVYGMFYYAANDKDYADLLLACQDGYIRKFDDSAKDDDSGATDTAISSYCTLPIQPLAADGDHEGKLTSLTVTTAGGATDGAFGDTDSVSYELHKGDAAETVLEDIVDGATALESGTLSGTGRKERIRKRVRGAYLGVKLSNSTAEETWAVEAVAGEVVPAGKIK